MPGSRSGRAEWSASLERLADDLCLHTATSLPDAMAMTPHVISRFLHGPAFADHIKRLENQAKTQAAIVGGTNNIVRAVNALIKTTSKRR